MKSAAHPLNINNGSSHDVTDVTVYYYYYWFLLKTEKTFYFSVKYLFCYI